MSLARLFKIHDRSRIEYILKKGVFLRGRLLHLKYLKCDSTAETRKNSRFSLILSSKISKKAVERNKIRRRIYEAIRLNWHAMPKTCYDLVVLPSQRIVQATFQDIKKDFLYIITKFIK